MKRRPDGRWQKIKKIDGKSIAFYSTAPTQKQAEREIERKMLEYSASLKPQKHNFKSIAERALEFQSKSIEHNTIECYYNSLKHLSPFFDLNIEDIEPIMLQDLLDRMAKKLHYSFSAVSKTKVTFGIILNYAIVQEKIPLINFMRSIKISKSAKKGKVAAPDDEVIRIIVSNATKVDFGMWPMVLLCTGARRGEQVAFRKKSINFETKEIKVTDAVEFISNNPHIKGTKNEASVGTVPILDILYQPLYEMCKDLKPDDFIFGGEKPLTKAQIDYRLKKYCKQIGHTFTNHQLRHAFAKLLYKAEVDVKTAQRLLRHADFNTTMNIYTEFDNEVTDNSLNRINNYMPSLMQKT